MTPSLAVALLLAVAGPAQATDAASSLEIEKLISQLPSRHWEAAVDALVEIGPPAVDTLTAVARQPGHTGGRACEALARIGTSRAFEVVREIARGESDGSRRGAVAALALDPSAESRVILVATLEGAVDWGLRAQAARSLGRLRAGEAVEPLTHALGDEVEWVRVASIEALGRIGAIRAAPRLLERLTDTRAVQREARRALVEIGEPAVPAVVRVSDHSSPDVRWQAAWVLRHIPGGTAHAALASFEADFDWRVRNEVAAARESRLLDSLPLYPDSLASVPAIPSPSTRADGQEVVLALTAEETWAVVPVGAPDVDRRERQRRVDDYDFPTLARTGLHGPEELAATVTITGRSLAEITDLGRPGGLSEDGFMAADEDVLSVLEGDNHLVSALGLTHPQLARPLFHLWNMIEADIEAGRWNYPEHRWDQVRQIVYNHRRIDLEARDTKGGQESIFEDGLGGAFYIKIQRQPTSDELRFLRERYGALPGGAWNAFIQRLSVMETAEMEPHYIQWYGFYEGHTGWRTDPVAIAFIFGLRSLEEIETAFPGRLPEVLTAHFRR
jgi:HEAT repeat protein